MTPERWTRVAQIYESALERDPSIRAAFVAEACGGDDTLRREVESLLAHDATPVVVDRELDELVAAVLEPESLVGPDTRLGPYRIERLLAAGGMGHVYRAIDTRLNRTVAIKVLPPTFADDRQSRLRFDREAQIIASLAHPHISALYDVGRERLPSEAGGQDVDYLVLEYLEGETLATRLERGALPFEEALMCAIQIVEALDAAHRRGIVHRDLKPSNIFLVRGAGGTASPATKLLDFGLAKPAKPVMDRPDVLRVSTAPPALTAQGTIVGTVQYMAPEQLEGRDADARTDIFAFGAVVYEMCTGRKAFEGKSQASLIGAIMNGAAPPISGIQPVAPPFLDQIVMKCLAKDPEDRWQSAADVATQLRWLLEHRVTVDAAAGRRAISRSFALTVALLVAAVTLGVLATRRWTASSAPAQTTGVTRFTMSVPANEFVTNGRNFIALSSDGKALAYSANWGINLRLLDRLEPIRVRGTESAKTETARMTSLPFFSPDGQWIGFWQNGEIKKVSINGGAPVTIASGQFLPPAGSFWQDDGSFLSIGGRKLLRVTQTGDGPQVLASDMTDFPQSAQLLPDRRTLLLTVFRDNAPFSEPEIVVRSVDTGEERVLIRGGLQAQYVSTGHLVYVEDRTLLAVRFDLETLSVRGSPVPVAENIATSGVPGHPINVAHVAISPAGTLAYLSGSFIEASRRALVWVDRRGREEPIGAPEHPYVAPRLSPDGKRIAVTVHDRERDIWIWDVAQRVLTPLTRFPGNDRYSLWTPDGARIVFASVRGNEAGVWSQQADGTGLPQRVAGFPFRQFSNFVPSTMSRDGTLVASVFSGAASDLWTLKLTGDRQAAALLQTPAPERNAELSPNGRWMAYESLVGERFEIHLRPFPDVNGGVWQLSHGGGSQPRWAPDGRDLFFFDSAGALTAVATDNRTLPTVGAPTKVLDPRYVWSVPTYVGRMYDMSPDGKRFLMMKQAGLEDQSNVLTNIVIVQNWFEELQRLVR